MIDFNKLNEERKLRMKEKFAKIPKINLEILKYSNNHSKDEVLLKYPEHSEFINKIIFN